MKEIKKNLTKKIVGGICKIGVLGGIGPEATAIFYSKLIQKLQDSGLIKSNKDFPQIVINSIPAPELIYEKISDEELQPYINGLKELDKFGVKFIVIVCNTAYLYRNKFQKEINTPILDLRKGVKEALKRKGIKSVLVIGTKNTIKNRLYKLKNIKTFEPNEKEIKILTNAIFNFNRGFRKQVQIKKVKKICKKYLDKGAEAIILGCTEFGVMLDRENLPTINTIDILVEITIQNIYNFYTAAKRYKKIKI